MRQIDYEVLLYIDENGEYDYSSGFSGDSVVCVIKPLKSLGKELGINLYLETQYGENNKYRIYSGGGYQVAEYDYCYSKNGEISAKLFYNLLAQEVAKDNELLRHLPLQLFRNSKEPGKLILERSAEEKKKRLGKIVREQDRKSYEKRCKYEMNEMKDRIKFYETGKSKNGKPFSLFQDNKREL